jgi:hypothetical protein
MNTFTLLGICLLPLLIGILICIEYFRLTRRKRKESAPKAG